LTMSLRRYEILLPLQHNDGSPVAPAKFKQTRRELIEEFGAVTFDPQPMHGVWVHDDREYEDTLVRAVVDVEDTPRSRTFFLTLKEILKERFQQLEIWITYHDIGRV